MPTPTLLSFSIQVNENSIFVFGGMTEEDKATTQAYLINIEEEEEFDQKDNLSKFFLIYIGKSMGFLFKLNYYPLKTAGFSLTHPLLVSNLNQTQIYALLYHD